MRRPIRRARQVAAIASLSVLMVLAGCGSSSGGSASDGSGTDQSSDSAEAPTSFALALGIDADDPDARVPLADYDLVVVDGVETDAATVAVLQDQGAQVLAYLSVGTIEPGRDWYAEAKDEGWLLDHWDDWDEWYAAVDQPGLRDLLVGEADDILDKGFDGLFLDNTDMVDGHPDQRRGMQQLVADLDETVGADRLLFAQNGEPVANGIARHLDGWNREDVSWTYDFDTKSYEPVSAEDHRDAVDTLRDLHDRGLIVTATDYTDGSDPGVGDEAAVAACQADAIPFVSDIGLDRFPDPPLTCDG